MTRNTKIFLVFILLILASLSALFLYCIIKDHHHRCVLRAKDRLLYEIFQEIVPLIDQCRQKRVDTESITVRGNILVWHVPVDGNGSPKYSTYYHSGDYGDYRGDILKGVKVPAESECVICDTLYCPIVSRNDPATLFLVLHSGKIKEVDRYVYAPTNIDAGPAVSEEVDICVLYWPEKTVVGSVTIKTEPSIQIIYGRDEFGRYFGGPSGGRTVGDWIYSLEQATTFENKAEFYRKTGNIDEAEKLEEEAKRIRLTR